MECVLGLEERSIIRDKDTDWNDKLELVVKNIGESSKSYKLMHIHEAQRSNKIYNTLLILGIIMGPLAGIISGIGEILNPDTDHTIPIIATVFSFLSGTIVTIIKVGKYDEYSNANKQAAARYTSIESNVRRQLSLYRSDRVSVTPYIKWLENKYDELFLSAPLLQSGVYDRYSIKAKNMGLKVPTKYEPVITINTDYENTKLEEIVNVTDININEVQKNSNDQTYNITDTDLQLPTSEKKIKRSSTMTQFPELNQCSDKLLEYEMKRMMGII